MKADLIFKDQAQNHCFGLELSYEEIMAEKKLSKLRETMLEKDPTLLTHQFQSKIKTLLESPLYKCLYLMPKPAIHHLHMTATVSTSFLLELTYDNRVYFSEKENLFKVSGDPNFQKEGYVRVNTLRHYWKDAAAFDHMLVEKMSLRPHATHREDHKIWEDFQFKFSLTFELYCYKHFFYKVMYRCFKEFIRENSTIVEIRHIFGCLFDENGPVPLEEEIKMF